MLCLEILSPFKKKTQQHCGLLPSHREWCLTTIYSLTKVRLHISMCILTLRQKAWLVWRALCSKKTWFMLTFARMQPVSYCMSALLHSKHSEYSWNAPGQMADLISSDILSLLSFGQLMFILQPFKDGVKARTEGSVNYKRLPHQETLLLPGKKRVAVRKGMHIALPSPPWSMGWCCLFQTLCLLSLHPWDRGIKVGCFSVRNHCTPQSITCEPCQVKAEYIQFLGEEGKQERKRKRLQNVLFVCLMIKKRKKGVVSIAWKYTEHNIKV